MIYSPFVITISRGAFSFHAPIRTVSVEAEIAFVFANILLTLVDIFLKYLNRYKIKI